MHESYEHPPPVAPFAELIARYVDDAKAAYESTLEGARQKLDFGDAWDTTDDAMFWIVVRALADVRLSIERPTAIDRMLDALGEECRKHFAARALAEAPRLREVPRS